MVMDARERVMFSRRAAEALEHPMTPMDRARFRAALVAALAANGRDSLPQPFRDWYDRGASNVG